ncbi:NUDIX domain-containing protein [Brevirhabdus pacifica]|uniref:NUDIX domain-containing protein n=1 Tax=Brevirhabdus pacifica TaxID=1267768 RepID=UPI0009F96F26|nr:NUDIX domain-containing protein [Brevirhabdus pacifica]
MQGLAHRYARRPGPTAPDRAGTIAVAACIVRDQQGRVLLAQRRADQMSPGTWEIPGGKVEPGEAAADAAIRELHEETGLVARNLRPVSRYAHRFERRSIELTLFEAAEWSGTPHGRENQRLDWVRPDQPHVAPILGSNFKALKLLTLPPRVMQVDPPAVDVSAWARDAALRARSSGAGAVFLACRRLPPAQQAALAGRLQAELSRQGIALWVDAAPDTAARAGAVLSTRCAQGPRQRGSGMIYAAIDPCGDEARHADVILLRDRPLPEGVPAFPPIYVFAGSPMHSRMDPRGLHGVICRNRDD